MSCSLSFVYWYSTSKGRTKQTTTKIGKRKKKDKQKEKKEKKNDDDEDGNEDGNENGNENGNEDGNADKANNSDKANNADKVDDIVIDNDGQIQQVKQLQLNYCTEISAFLKDVQQVLEKNPSLLKYATQEMYKEKMTDKLRPYLNKFTGVFEKTKREAQTKVKNCEHLIFKFKNLDII